jgi:polar amino acid transport system substrate-binding protein
MSIARLVLLLAFLPLAAGAQVLHLTTESSYPSAYLDHGRVVGYATDKLHEALRRAGVAHDIDLLPWPRALASARGSAATCVYPTARTPERAGAFKWVGPVARTEWWLYGLARRNFAIANLADARGLRIGAYNGDVRAEYLKQHGFAVDAVTNDDFNPRKLVLGRIDLWVTGPLVARRKLHDLGLADEVAPVLMFNRIDLYLACNLATPDAQLAKIGAALEAMDKDGTTRRIEHAYGADPVQPRARKSASAPNAPALRG